MVDTANAAVSDTTHRCASITIGWAQCGEPTAFYTSLNKIFARGASQGQSIFVATGDVGVAAPTLFNRKTGGCQFPPKPEIEENAGSPHVTAIGASMFNPTYDSNGNVTSTAVDTTQYVWFFNFDNVILEASTAGYGKIFARPAYQKAVKTIKGPKRALPDIVLGGGNIGFLKNSGLSFPTPGIWECLDVGFLTAAQPRALRGRVSGGTSIVPPQYAGIIAIIAQKTGAKQGLINTKLYAMAKANLTNLKAVGIYDILSEDNSYFPLTGYSAGPGFDLASGWGSIDINLLVTSFINFTPPKKR